CTGARHEHSGRGPPQLSADASPHETGSRRRAVAPEAHGAKRAPAHHLRRKRCGGGPDPTVGEPAFQSMKPLAMLLVCASLLVMSAPARGEEPEAFVRVGVGETELRAGPGVSHRVIHVASRGDVFFLQERSGSDFWFKVVMADAP